MINETAEIRLKFLADASQLLSGSLDYETTLSNVAHLSVPVCADWCAVDMFEKDGRIRRLAVVHSDSQKTALGFELFEKYPPQPSDAHGLVLVMKTGAPQFYPEIPDELLVSTAFDPEHLEIIRSLGMKSAIVMPMKVQNRVLGAITLVFAESDRRYRAKDLDFVYDLASRAALAIENARLFTEASESVLREKESAAVLNILLMSAPVAFAFLDRDLRYARVNNAFEKLMDKPRDEVIGTIFGSHYAQDVRDLNLDLMEVMKSRRPLLNIPVHAGETRHSLANYFPVISDNEVLGIGVLIYDITDHKNMEQKIREQARINEKLHEVGLSLTAELNLDRIVQTVTDAATELSGAQFGAFFYNVLKEDGEAYTLYCISGVPREKFSQFPMPRNTKIFAPTFMGERIVRLDDVTRDGNFGHNAPYHGMPAGHLPVRSYLAVPVISRTGEVLGGLFFGHEKPGVFTESAEKLVAGLAPQAAIAIDNARLFDTANISRNRLQSQLNFTDALTKSLGEGLCAFDQDRKVIFVNPATTRLLGWSHSELMGKDLTEVFPADENTAVWNKVLHQKRMVEGESTFIRKDGSSFPASYLAAPFVEKESVQGVVITIRDITETRRIQDELQRSREELEQRVVERTVNLTAANQELEAFSYSVSHDLRSPLRSIDGFSQALLEDYADKLDAEGQDSLQRIRAASQKMGRIIDDLLNLSKLTRTQMRTERIHISEMVQKILDEFRSSDKSRQVETLVQERLLATGDSSLLRIALENLLSNAWKFTGKQEKARIVFGAERINGEIIYFVEDNGAGFNMQYGSKLFGAFQRLHQAHEFSGTGIGLATVRRIIHRHGGRIWAESEVGRGAKFFFTLPTTHTDKETVR
ncbi:MAG TPA: GAF domain-containing protein [Oligoflexus sp.]|uniref:GAF domain-containing sensor histidine kinase n=1 Tax=Oligoflexus sp. TaxID=1971216 RepID=UPI002D7FF9F4|nr:GAF domain-containing protein [Oligoflexus sp.]HET9237356.1 GAF domain-containing protein [Oligoflexus sp.]